MKISFIGMGEAGIVYSVGLAVGGAEVAGYDLLIEKPEEMRRFAAARDAGVRIASSLQETVDEADLVIALTGGPAAMQAAESVKAYMKPGQIYTDLNSSTPIAKGKVRGLLKGVDVVDGAIMKASVSGEKHRTPIYLSGTRGDEAADILNKYGLNTTFIDSAFGAASGIKLMRGLFMKSIETSLMECVHAAVCLGIHDSFLKEIRKTFRDKTPFDSTIHDMITTCPNHAGRHGSEAENGLAIFNEIGIDATISRAVASKFYYIAGLGMNEKLGGVIPESIDEALQALPNPLK